MMLAISETFPMMFLLCYLGCMLDPYPVPKSLGPVESYGKNIQRTMRLLATSTPKKPNQVTVLFYGQSITDQNWWKIVAEDLRKRFPHAKLRIENHAIGGFSSQILVKMLESDIAALQPDLIIFHVYGSHMEYENIFKWIRTYTAAEVLQQTDHVTKPEDLTEERDPEKLSHKQWSAWMNHSFLPSMAVKYQTELVNQHELWKQYLRDHHLEPKRLLSDTVHLNDHGCYLMAEIAKAYLRYDAKLGSSPAENWTLVTAIEPSQWKGNTLELEWTGKHLHLIHQNRPLKISVEIDGQPLPQVPVWLLPTRSTNYPGSNWPCLLQTRFEQPRLEEEWTITLKGVDDAFENIRFTLHGSVTGEDGSGSTSGRFVSKSGRVVIEKDDWNFIYAGKVFGKKLQPGFQIKWRVLPYHALHDDKQNLRLDRNPLELPANEKDPERQSIQATPLASGLKNTKHKLKITLVEGNAADMTGLQLYHPILGRD